MSLIKQFNYNLCNLWFKRILMRNTYQHKYFSVYNGFPERSVQIQTCGNIYRKWKEQRFFFKIPEGDLIFNVPYIDTQPNISTLPTVLALHGAPGSWRDFTFLSSYLHDSGYRFIAPTFPSFHDCRPGIFRHTGEEKAQFVKDFLTAISVSHVDYLICHSGATFPGLLLCLEDHSKIKALCLLNPGSFNVKAMRGTKFYPLLKFMVKAIENTAVLKFVEVCGPFIFRNIINVPVRFESILDPLLSATTMVNGKATESKEKFQKVSQKLPILYIFSDNDPLMSTKPSYELAECLGASSSDIFIYNSEGKLIQKGRETSELKVLAFQKGSHYAFLKYPELINKEIADFLKLLHND